MSENIKTEPVLSAEELAEKKRRRREAYKRKEAEKKKELELLKQREYEEASFIEKVGIKINSLSTKNLMVAMGVLFALVLILILINKKNHQSSQVVVVSEPVNPYYQEKSQAILKSYSAAMYEFQNKNTAQLQKQAQEGQRASEAIIANSRNVKAVNIMLINSDSNPMQVGGANLLPLSTTTIIYNNKSNNLQVLGNGLVTSKLSQGANGITNNYEFKGVPQSMLKIADFNFNCQSLNSQYKELTEAEFQTMAKNYEIPLYSFNITISSDKTYNWMMTVMSNGTKKTAISAIINGKSQNLSCSNSEEMEYLMSDVVKSLS